MAEAQKIASPLTLRLKRTMPFPRERVFAAFSQQEQMNQWMCRDAKNHEIRYTKFDFRVGGRERFGHQWQGTTYRYDALYYDIVPDQRIVYSYEMYAASAQAGPPSSPATLTGATIGYSPSARWPSWTSTSHLVKKLCTSAFNVAARI